ncbi:MAG: hypothetical protein ACRD2G_10020, partial [Terriglobia bacterium]
FAALRMTGFKMFAKKTRIYGLAAQRAAAARAAVPFFVIPAEAGIHLISGPPLPRLRGGQVSRG